MAARVAVKNTAITSSGLNAQTDCQKKKKKSDFPAEGHAASKQLLPLREDALLYYAADYGSELPLCCKTFLKKLNVCMAKFKFACPPNSSVSFGI